MQATCYIKFRHLLQSGAFRISTSAGRFAARMKGECAAVHSGCATRSFNKVLFEVTHFDEISLNCRNNTISWVGSPSHNVMLSVKLLCAAVDGSPTSSHALMSRERKREGERGATKPTHSISPLALWKCFRWASCLGPLSYFRFTLQDKKEKKKTFMLLPFRHPVRP